MASEVTLERRSAFGEYTNAKMSRVLTAELEYVAQSRAADQLTTVRGVKNVKKSIFKKRSGGKPAFLT
jgi:hypothetical protein